MPSSDGPRFEASDWIFERVSTARKDNDRDSGFIRVRLRNVPSCRCIVAELRKLRWWWERDDERKISFSSYKDLRAQQRGHTVWVVGVRVSKSGGAEESKPVACRIGPWPKIAAAGRAG